MLHNQELNPRYGDDQEAERADQRSDEHGFAAQGAVVVDQPIVIWIVPEHTSEVDDVKVEFDVVGHVFTDTCRSFHQPDQVAHEQAVHRVEGDNQPSTSTVGVEGSTS